MAQSDKDSSPRTSNQPEQEIIEPARSARWTADRQLVFLKALASSHCVSAAARIAGMSRQSAYELRTRLKGQPFDRAWDAALQCSMDALADAALDRALNGVEVPHFHKGELIHTSRKFDERLTVALLAMRENRRPTYIPQSNPASAYPPDGMGGELTRLLARIERGPERWDG